MTRPLPEKVDLIAEIREKTLAGRMSEFDLARLRRLAKQAISSDPSNGYAALGMLACLENKVDEMRRFHRMSIDNDPNSSILHSNYAASLVFLREYGEAIEQAALAFKIDAANIGALDLIIRAAYTIDMRDALDKHLAIWHALGKGEHPIEEDMLNDDEDAAAALEAREEVSREGAIPWDDFCSSLSL
jgi:hypothetical protein